MTYLEPPPAPAPVVVAKDVGGFVDQYREQTERYRSENREVRLHECRSACTLALSLPNVCVYPTSIVKFHKAYDANTRVTDESISRELFNAYPPAVQARLGQLTREYRILRGSELIELGIRDCNEKRTIMVAKNAAPAERQTGIASAVQSLVASILSPIESAANAPTATPAPVEPAAPAVPLPPRRPIEVASLSPEIDLTSQSEPAPEALSNAPLPPRRPAEFASLGSLELHRRGNGVTVSAKPIAGAIAPLQARFVAYTALKPLEVAMITRILRDEPAPPVGRMAAAGR